MSGCVNACDCCFQVERMEARVAALENPWISVDDRLPEYGEAVLVLTDYGGMDVCRRVQHQYSHTEDQTDHWINCMRPQHSNGSVTHWTPIRPLPKDIT